MVTNVPALIKWKLKRHRNQKTSWSSLESRKSKMNWKAFRLWKHKCSKDRNVVTESLYKYLFVFRIPFSVTLIRKEWMVGLEAWDRWQQKVTYGKPTPSNPFLSHFFKCLQPGVHFPGKTQIISLLRKTVARENKYKLWVIWIYPEFWGSQ